MEVRHSRKTVSLYLNTTIGQLENLLKLEHQAKLSRWIMKTRQSGEYSFVLSTKVQALAVKTYFQSLLQRYL